MQKLKEAQKKKRKRVCCLEQHQTLERLLVNVESLVKAYGINEYTFPKKVSRWLENTESLLRDIGAKCYSRFVILRGVLVSKVAGNCIEGKNRSRKEIRKLVVQSSINVLVECEKVLKEEKEKVEKRISGTRSGLAKAVQEAASNGLLNPPDRNRTQMEWMCDNWNILLRYPPSRALAVRSAAGLFSYERMEILNSIFGVTIEKEK